jgi:hypothetical protein
MFPEQSKGPHNFLVYADQDLNTKSIFYVAVQKKDQQPRVCELLNAAVTVRELLGGIL